MISNVFNRLVLTVCVLGIAACAKTDSTSKTSEDVSDQTESVLVNGEKASDAYSKFLHQVNGSCQDKNNLWFLATGFIDFEIGKSAQGNPIKANVTVYMNEGGSYTANYTDSEYTSCREQAGATSCSLVKLHDQWFEGRWSVEGGKLVLSGLGEANYITYNEKPALQLTLQQGFFVNAQASGKQVTGWKIATNVASGGDSINQYCENDPAQ